jgi:RHS repeat-associated protein
VQFAEGKTCGPPANAGTTHQFTGFERDGETGLDYASARHYSGQLGRFMVPDPLGIGAASLTNPQTLNQYAYVNGNPMNFVDPSGLDGECADDPSCGGDLGGGDWGGVPGWGGGVNLGGPIWGEQVPRIQRSPESAPHHPKLHTRSERPSR